MFYTYPLLIFYIPFFYFVLFYKLILIWFPFHHLCFFPHLSTYSSFWSFIHVDPVLKKLFNLQLQTCTLWWYKDQHKFSQQSSRLAHILFFALSSIFFLLLFCALIWFFRVGGRLSSVCKHILRQAVHLIVFHVKSHEISLHKLGSSTFTRLREEAGLLTCSLIRYFYLAWGLSQRWHC